MLNIDFTFLFAAINLLVLYLFLKKFLFGRVGDFMEQRSAKIAADIEKATQAKQQGEQFRQQYEDALKNATIEKQQILNEAKQKAAKHYDTVVANANSEAARILKTATEDAVRERELMLAGLRAQVATLAISAASKIIEANMDTEKNHDLVEEFLKKEVAA